MITATLETEETLLALGGALAHALPSQASVYLRGELGAGKTTLTRGIVQTLGHHGAVKSPTYTLVEPYLDIDKPLYHFDLYRLGDPEELEFMGMRDYFDAGGLIVIEWPERGAGFLPEPDLEIRLQVCDPGRRADLCALSDRGVACLDALDLDRCEFLTAAPAEER